MRAARKLGKVRREMELRSALKGGGYGSSNGSSFVKPGKVQGWAYLMRGVWGLQVNSTVEIVLGRKSSKKRHVGRG